MIHHYVMIKFSSQTPEGHIESFGEKMKALDQNLPEMHDFVFGIDEFHESRSWDVVLYIVFRTHEDLQIYQEHREHQEIIEFNKPYIESIASVDFTS